MLNRISLCDDIEKKIVELQSVLNLSTKAAVIRMAIAISIKEKEPLGEDVFAYFKKPKSNNYQLFTITGVYAPVYKALLENNLGTNLETDDAFEKEFELHIIRGVLELYSYYQLKGNKDRLLLSLIDFNVEVSQ